MDRYGDTVGPADESICSTMNLYASTLEQEAMAGGWIRSVMPTGGKPPPRAITSGMRGEEEMDSDVDAGPGDQSYYTGA